MVAVIETSVQITNDSFLKEIFGKLYNHAHTTSFLPDPFTVKRTAWQGRWYSQQFVNGSATIESWDYNNYFVISLFDPGDGGAALRRKELFQACYLVIIDDVLSKVSPKTLKNCGFPEPSYKLESSPGNQQWGYIFKTPVTQRHQIEYLLDRWVDMGISADGKDPGMKGVTRYMRLPVGCNTKAVYGEPFKHRLVEWTPDRRYSIEELAKLTEINLDEAEADEGYQVKEIPEENDPMLRALSDAGLLKKKIKTATYDITCPWIEEHTERADTGTAYFQPGGFECHHGHCEGRTGGDLRQWLTEHGHSPDGTAAELFDGVTADNVVSMTPGEVLGQGSDPELTRGQPEELPWEDGFEGDYFEASIIDPRYWQDKPVPERQWLWKDWIPFGSVTGLGGPGGSAKSTLAQQICTHVVLGRDFLNASMSKVNTLYITCEDDASELQRRQHNINQALDVEMQDLEGFHMASWVGQDAVLVRCGKERSMTETVNYKNIQAYIKDQNIRLLILDVIPDFWNGNEIDRNQVNLFVKRFLAGLARQTNAAVVCIYHPSQTGMKSGGTSGSTAWDGSFRSRLYMNVADKMSGLRTLSRMKANYAGLDDKPLLWKRGYLWGSSEAISIEVIRNKETNMREIFIACLKHCESIGTTISPAPNSDMYYGKAFPKVWQKINAEASTESLPLLPMKDFQTVFHGLISDEVIKIIDRTNKQARRIILNPEGDSKVTVTS